MGKQKMKGFILGVVFTLVMVSTVNVVASSVKANIEVIYNNIKLVVDGKPVELGKDSANKKIEPFIYNGTTYLPVRAVGEAMGKKVDWDGKTSTVYLGEKPGEVNYMTETIEPYDNYYVDLYKLDSPNKLNIAGKEYNTAYLGRTVSNAKLQFNLNSEYTSLSFDLGPSTRYSSTPSNLHVYLDNKLYKSYEVTENSPIQTINIDLKGVNQLRFEFKSNWTGIGIGDPIIK